MSKSFLQILLLIIMCLSKHKFLAIKQEWWERCHAVTNNQQGMNYERTIFILICKNDKKMRRM